MDNNILGMKQTKHGIQYNMASIIKVDTIQDQDGNNIINENANTVTIGKSGDTVQVAAGAEFVGGGTQWQSSIVTGTTLSAVAGNGYWIDTTSNACTVTLPASASVGDTIEFSDYARTWGTNAVTINTNSLNFQGGTSNPIYSTSGSSIRIVYSGATQGWIPTDDDEVTNTQSYSVDFLVIAGGGGGGYDRGGGGGAGGYRNSYSTEPSGGGGSSETSLTLNGGTVYTITVGAGGAGATSTGGTGLNGGDSSISGSDITDITSAGGGGAGNGTGPSNRSGVDGGSGGAAGYNANGAGSGTTNQGFAGGDAPNAPSVVAGGGGGASEVGDSSFPYGGGDGLSSSITSSAVTRAGGGGGHNAEFNSPPGGAGGGGNGGRDAPAATSPTPGTANTGGGGGGGSGGGGGITGADGGSGVVILRMPTANYSGTTTGSPTVTTDGSDTILTYTGDGSYTA